MVLLPTYYLHLFNLYHSWCVLLEWLQIVPLITIWSGKYSFSNFQHTLPVKINGNTVPNSSFTLHNSSSFHQFLYSYLHHFFNWITCFSSSNSSTHLYPYLNLTPPDDLLDYEHGLMFPLWSIVMCQLWLCKITSQAKSQKVGLAWPGFGLSRGLSPIYGKFSASTNDDTKHDLHQGWRSSMILFPFLWLTVFFPSSIINLAKIGLIWLETFYLIAKEV